MFLHSKSCYISLNEMEILRKVFERLTEFPQRYRDPY